MNDYSSRMMGDYMLSAEAKHDRAVLNNRIILAACVLGVLIFGPLLYWQQAYAQDIPLHVLEKDGVSIRLMNAPCVDPVSVTLIRSDALHRFKAIESVWPEKDGSRKAYAGCWADLTAEEAGGEPAFLVVFSDGATAAIPVAEFKKVRGQRGA